MRCGASVCGRQRQTEDGIDGGKHLRLHPRIQHGPERGPADSGPAQRGHTGGKHLHGQAVWQGFQPSPVQTDGGAPAAGRPPLCPEHRPPGPQL